MFKVIAVDHVGIACKDLDLSKKFYTDILGLECTGEEAVPDQGVKTVFIKCGETLIELLVDITETTMALSANISRRTVRASSTWPCVWTTW